MVLAAVAGVAITTGCADAPEKVAGDAAPVGAATPTAPASPSASPRPSASASPSAVSSSSPVASREPSRSPSSAASVSVLGPTGLGRLKVGMTKKAALATGLVEASAEESRCDYWRLKADPTGGTLITASSARGIIAITVTGRIATPEGIRIGSTLAQVKRAYTDFTIRAVDAEGGFNGTGTTYAGTKDEYANVHYRFGFKDGKVGELGLEHDRQDCYE
nr:hypothetical protein Ade03nite_87930 [Actinoplanes derwentensis]